MFLRLSNKSSRPQWHRIYYLLAFFDVLVVLMGLYLTHQIINRFNQSVTTNLLWEQRLDRYLELGEIAAEVNAPGNDVFDTRLEATEAQQMQTQLVKFQAHMRDLRQDAQANLTPSQATQLLHDLDLVDAAMAKMVAEADLIFSFFRENKTDLAGARMAAMDRTYHNLNRALAIMRKDVSAIQRELFAEQQRAAASLQQFEYMIAAFVLVMITGAMFYGHQIRRQMEAGEREREHYITGLQAADNALKRANDELELKVQERTTELETANQALQTEMRERERTTEELRQSEEQLRQAQKMEAVGRLAGGIAHDFNNLLAAIMGYSDLLLLSQGLNEATRARVGEIKKASERAANLTQQLLAFGRKQVLQPRLLDLNVLVLDTVKLLDRVVGEQVELKTELTDKVPHIEADPNQIQQILINLAVNARDAMPEGGALVIATAITELSTKAQEEHNRRPTGRYVLLSVSDQGHGMDAETQAHIFEPFFTTKQPGKGTGLGLATVYGIVQQSNGLITVQSAIGQGTTFKVYLPWVDRLPDVEAQPLAPVHLLRGAEKILLVEDDITLRAMIEEVLQEIGYAVQSVANANAALKLSEQQGISFDLLITDVVMPGMNGREVAERLTANHPLLRVLYMSGYTNQTIGNNGVLDRNTWFIQKPFAIDAFTALVRQVLDTPPQQSFQTIPKLERRG